MRKIGSLLWMAIFVLGGCDKNDDNDPKNVLNYDGESYVLRANGSFISDYGSETIAENDFYNYRFTLSDGTDFDENGPEDASIIVLLNLFSSSDEEFKTGTYNFSDAEEPTGNFLEGTSGIVFDDETTVAEGGSVTVNKSGSRWIINYELELENDKTASGTFEASLEIVDMTE